MGLISSAKTESLRGWVDTNFVRLTDCAVVLLLVVVLCPAAKRHAVHVQGPA